MGKEDKYTELDKDKIKRLERLGGNWDESISSLNQERLTPADIRLLLEHFQPLQDLIRAVATAATGGTSAMPMQGANLRTNHVDLSHAQSELYATQQQCIALKDELAKCNAATRQLMQANGKLESQLQQVQKELSTCRAEFDRSGHALAELTTLRCDAELAKRFELADLPDDDTQALIRTVAVLSQMNNIERLWDALKAACDRQSRPASAGESALLQSALDWHNHNWKTKPFALHRPGVGKSFDFSKEQRAASTPSGDNVCAVWLPGIVSGNGTVQKKALVVTR